MYMYMYCRSDKLKSYYAASKTVIRCKTEIGIYSTAWLYNVIGRWVRTYIGKAKGKGQRAKGKE